MMKTAITIIHFKLRYLFYAAALFAAVFLSSCEKGFIFDNNSVAAVQYDTGRFDTLIVNDIFDIRLKTGSVHSVLIEGSRKAIENIPADVKANTLTLSDDNKFKWLPDYPLLRITITFPPLSRIVLNTPSTVTSADTLLLEDLSIFSLGQTAIIDLAIRANNIRINTEMDNFGQYTLRGYSRYADLWHRGSSRLFAGDLETEFLKITNNSTAASMVNVNRRLSVVINHYGNVYYRGRADELLILEMSSSGQLIRYDE